MKNYFKNFDLKKFKFSLEIKTHKKKIIFLLLGLLIPNLVIGKSFKDACIFNMDLLVSDPVTSGQNAGITGLQALGFSNRSADESTLKAVLASRSVTNLLTKELKNKYKNDKDVTYLINKINSSWKMESNNTALSINTKRGDRFQDLSIINVSLIGNKSVLTKIDQDIIDFYEKYGPIYKANRTKTATQFANDQIERLVSEYREINNNLRKIRKESFGFQPSIIIDLFSENYISADGIKTTAEFEIASNALNTIEGKGLSPIAQKVYNNNLQPIVTSSSFLKILNSYNILKVKYDQLVETRSKNDKELNAIKGNIDTLEKMFQDKVGSVDLNIEDFPSADIISELITEIINTQKSNSLIKKANKEQEYYSNIIEKNYKLAEDYQLLAGEVDSISTTLIAYKDLKEKLLLDAAQDLSSWNVIGSDIQCSYLTLKTYISLYSVLYLFAVLYFESKSLRRFLNDFFKKLKENF